MPGAADRGRGDERPVPLAALGRAANALYACWKGELGDQSIWFSHFNGTTWAPQKQIPGVGTSPDLVKTAGTV